MERPRVADGGDGLHTWRVATNILNKQSRTTSKGWGPPAWGLGEGLITPRPKNPACHEMLHRVSDLDGFFGRTEATTNGYQI
jgi:hypothetical protein